MLHGLLSALGSTGGKFVAGLFVLTAAAGTTDVVEVMEVLEDVADTAQDFVDDVEKGSAVEPAFDDLVIDLGVENGDGDDPIFARTGPTLIRPNSPTTGSGGSPKFGALSTTTVAPSSTETTSTTELGSSTTEGSSTSSAPTTTDAVTRLDDDCGSDHYHHHDRCTHNHNVDYHDCGAYDHHDGRSDYDDDRGANDHHDGRSDYHYDRTRRLGLPGARWS